MPLDVNREIRVLKEMTLTQLRQRYAEVHDDPSRSGHRQWLVRRIIWRMQALEEGDLSERARKRAAELARDADLRLKPPPSAVRVPTSADSTAEPVPVATDNRRPMPGALITRHYRGRMVQVRVLADGFEYEGVTYRSLSAVAKVVSGSHWNGWLFFGLTEAPTRKGATR